MVKDAKSIIYIPLHSRFIVSSINDSNLNPDVGYIFVAMHNKSRGNARNFNDFSIHR